MEAIGTRTHTHTCTYLPNMYECSYYDLVGRLLSPCMACHYMYSSIHVYTRMFL